MTTPNTYDPPRQYSVRKNATEPTSIRPTMWAHLEDAIREGTPRWKQTFGTEGGIFSGFFRTDESKRAFLKGMHGFGRISSPAVAGLYPGTLADDFFTDPLPAADLYSLGRILHDWSGEKIHRLLEKIHAALPTGGGLLIAEKLLRPDYVAAHMQSLNMLIGTESRVTGSYLEAMLGIK